MSVNSTVLATVISPNGEVDSVPLPSDDDPRLRELQSLVGGCIEAVSLPGGRYMVLNENGKDGPHLVNTMATAIAHEAKSIQKSDYIAGVAVVLPRDALE